MEGSHKRFASFPLLLRSYIITKDICQNEETDAAIELTIHEAADCIGRCLVTTLGETAAIVKEQGPRSPPAGHPPFLVPGLWGHPSRGSGEAEGGLGQWLLTGWEERSQ